MKTKRTEVSFESSEVWRIRQATGADVRECHICPNAVPMVLVEDLAMTTKISPREIYRAIERGELHFVDEPNARVFVCLASFSERNLQ
ncbi:MAG TPA: hypothetical protein VKB46_22210 [Pyrinomonadaceae bacterium]|nr:hypothetical protein [Pyrinomonadaceae bacterium]